LCDWRIPDEFPSGQYIANRSHVGERLTVHTPARLIDGPEKYREIRDGDLVWVRLSWLKSFIEQVLPLTKAKFVLATGDSVDSVPGHIEPYARAVLSHPNVICWFAQNCDRPSMDGLLRPLPLGIDFHTVSERPFWGQPVASPTEQEQELNAISGALPLVEQRIRDVYVDFAWGPVGYGGRPRIMAKIFANPRVFLQPSKLSRSEMWRQRGIYTFVVSPHGAGLDCHRTWEALALGHIVLVPRSPLDRMFNGLAVVSVDDWGEITPENLSRWLDRYGPLTRSNDALTSRWWVERMRGVARGGDARDIVVKRSQSLAEKSSSEQTDQLKNATSQKRLRKLILNRLRVVFSLAIVALSRFPLRFSRLFARK